MAFDSSLKFGSPVYYAQLLKAYEIGKAGKTSEGFMYEFKELLDYAQYVPYRNYRYEIGGLISKYYSNSFAMLDRTAVEMHAVLFGGAISEEDEKIMAAKALRHAERTQAVRLLKMSVPK